METHRILLYAINVSPRPFWELFYTLLLSRSHDGPVR